MKSTRIILLSTLGLSACHPQEKSRTLEFIDQANSLLTRYGLSEMPSYADIQSQSSVFTRDAQGQELLPWTDTYWPTTYKGMAQRWGALNAEQSKNLDPEADFSLGDFYASSVSAAKAVGLLSVHLSPAEKFDLLYQTSNKIDLNTSAELQQKLATIDLDLDKILAESTLSTADRVSKKRELARRYKNALRQRNASGQTLASYFPMTSESLNNWLDKSQQSYYQFPGENDGEGQDWSWEGLCHGWAPAAVMATEPKHAVRVTLPNSTDGKERQLLFTEGDLRGLLTKSWADANNRDMFFIGRRCEQNVADPDAGIKRNTVGRGVGGSFYLWKENSSQEVSFTLVQEYPRGTQGQTLMRIILEDEWQGTTPSIAYLVETNGGGSYFTRDEKKAFAAAESEQLTDLEYAQNVSFHGCWDVNPASFHTVLLENLGKANRGFVMDRTQTGQVWNQPIYKAEFSVGALTSVKDLADTDVAKAYRAPGTSFVATVTATVYWASEPNSALFTYTDSEGKDVDAQQIETSVYEYTLEFDAQQKLISGEWGNLQSFESDSPDFLFGFRKASQPQISGFQKQYLKNGYEKIIKKLHNCSLKDSADGTLEIELPFALPEMPKTKLSYVNCAL